MQTRVVPAVYDALLGEIKERIRSAQYAALRSVNRELISLYWEIGQLIEARQQGATWGKAVVGTLARDLRRAFPGLHGVSAQNLWRMRQFYAAYAGEKILSPLVREISWTKNIIILMRCKERLEREFYIRMTHKFGWTKNVLIHQLDNQTYEKTLLGQTNFDKTVSPAIRAQAKLAVKDEYTFDFLELGEEHAEREIERALVGRIERFLREMGGAFAFMGSQYRLEISDREYFIDLLLYHRALKCLLAVELKVGEFQPEYVGKMQFYLAALDDRVRLEHETPSIGMILCKCKDRTIVEYALRESSKPIGVGAYRIVKRLPRELKGALPLPGEIARLLGG